HWGKAGLEICNPVKLKNARLVLNRCHSRPRFASASDSRSCLEGIAECAEVDMRELHKPVIMRGILLDQQLLVSGRECSIHRGNPLSLLLRFSNCRLHMLKTKQRPDSFLR